MYPKNDNFCNSITYSKDAPKFDDEMVLYSKLYDLKPITKTIRVNKEYFDYCKSQTNFLILVLYDKTGKVFLKDNGINQFKLPGGTVFKDESIRDAVKRIIGKEVGQTAIEELEPIALSKNIFEYKNINVEHVGLVVMARLDSKFQKYFEKNFYFVNNSILVSVNQFSDKKILELFSKRYSTMLLYNSNEFQDEEIEVNRKYHSRYKFHNNIVKKYILTAKIKRKNQTSRLIHKKIEWTRGLLYF